MHTLILLALFTGALLAIKRILDVHKALLEIHRWPGAIVLLPSRGLIYFILKPKPIKYLWRGGSRPWRDKHTEFANYGVDIMSITTVLPNVNRSFSIADAAAIKEITTHRNRFVKPVRQYRALLFYGHNIVASEGDQWKRYRKICAPAFSERNNKMVWEETVRIMSDLFDTVWDDKREIVVDHAIDITLPIALFVISAAGFGQRIPWTGGEVIPDGHQMSFKEALHILSTEIFVKVIAPKWIVKYGPLRFRKVETAYNELELYMNELIQKRRSSEKKEERYDLLSSLLDANEEGADALTDSELRGNIFIFLLAGHETTAHTLCFTFAMLALYPDEQEKLHRHIKSIVSDGKIPTYEQMNVLTQSMAVLYETLRMFPPVHTIPKVAAEDTALTTVNVAGEIVTVPIPKGTPLTINTPGLHYNPRYWEDPYAFIPDRFLGNWPRDAFLPFSGGPRSCIGRRFFETEAIAILTMLISKYTIEVKDEPQFAHETFEQRKSRILSAKPVLTLTPQRVPLVFKKRST
ncbi:cytochrome P450 [Trametopsis cervina]|nr:cytochrome P450 [Trametopsis cervina]